MFLLIVGGSIACFLTAMTSSNRINIVILSYVILYISSIWWYLDSINDIFFNNYVANSPITDCFNWFCFFIVLLLLLNIPKWKNYLIDSVKNIEYYYTYIYISIFVKK